MTVRVRLLELRLLAVGLAVLWAIVAVLLLVGYRPGGPADLLVGIAALAPLGVAVAAVAWPPAARGRVAFRTIAALGVATVIVLLPTLAGLVRQLVEQGLQTLLPSLETAYPWVLAILGTSLFAGLGVARRILGPQSGRPGRLAAAIALGIGLAVVSAFAMAGATIANELALQDRPAAESRYGPTDPTLVPPMCDAPLVAGGTALLTLDLGGTLDGRSLGIARVRGARSARDFRWLAEVTTTREIGFAGAAVVGGSRLDPRAADPLGGRAGRGRRGRGPRPRGHPGGAGPDAAHRGRGPGPRLRRGRPGPPLPDRRRRGHLPARRSRRSAGSWETPTSPPGGASIDVWIFADGQLGRVEGRLGGARVRRRAGRHPGRARRPADGHPTGAAR